MTMTATPYYSQPRPFAESMTDAVNALASEEGWRLTDRRWLGGNTVERTRWRIERIIVVSGGQSRFANDEQAVQFVREMAARGSALHAWALREARSG